MSLKSQKRLYLDANATYGLLPEVTSFLTQFLENIQDNQYLNPSSIHCEGQRVRALVDETRSDLYDFLHLSESTHRIFFTSGATEGNNQALGYPFRESVTYGKPRLVSSSVEHSSVEEPLRRLEEDGVEVVRVRPDASGELSVDSVLSVMNEDTRLVSLMWANNETGVIHPIPEIFQRVRREFPQCILHTDAVQMFSKKAIDLRAFPFDFLTIAPHKFGGLPGVGITIASSALSLHSFLVGGAQELKWRPGTENTLGIASIGPALRKLPHIWEEYAQSTSQIRSEFERAILERYPSSDIVGMRAAHRLANTSLVYLPGTSTEDLVVALDLEGVACSRGSACSSGKQLGSHVLGGMSLPESASKEVLRFSFRSDFKKDDLKTVLERVFLCFDRSGVATTEQESATLSPSGEAS
ncbi:MAG: cysteine desulfurase family protein [Bdellovibrionota bacterium]